MVGPNPSASLAEGGIPPHMLGPLRAAEHPAAQAVLQPSESGNSEAGLKRPCFPRSLAHSGGQPGSRAPRIDVVQQHGFLTKPPAAELSSLGCTAGFATY